MKRRRHTHLKESLGLSGRSDKGLREDAPLEGRPEDEREVDRRKTRGWDNGRRQPTDGRVVGGGTTKNTEETV